MVGTVKWSFTRYHSISMPFSFYACSMSFDQYRAEGFGCSWGALEAAVKAFGEAWERIWFKHALERNLIGNLIASSNGFAAGFSVGHATDSSRNELIERSVFLKAWADQAGWASVHSGSWRARALKSFLHLRGWKVNFFNIHSNVGVVRACLLRHHILGSFFDTAFGQSPNALDEKLILSVAKNTFMPNLATQAENAGIATPESHLAFYKDPKNAEAFSFLDDLQVCAVVDLGSLSHVKSYTLVNDEVMPAVCYSSNENWLSLSWGGNSVRGKNLWPHPLA